ncbi:dehydrodolichyl diphosphate synthase complex subunit nus1-like, partial [Diaphorina citri]
GDSNFRKEYSNGPPCCIGNGITDGSNNKIHEKFDHPLTADLKWSNYKTELNILSRKQCESDLLNSIVELGETNLSVSDTIMKERLQEKCPLPDPEVAIVIGRKLSSYGLLPWNIRLTEFFQFDNYYDISASKFKNILRKYSKCEQRYGK